MTIKVAKRLAVRDSDLAKVGPALKRAAARAKRLAVQSGTPLYVWKAGRVVDLGKKRGTGYFSTSLKRSV